MSIEVQAFLLCKSFAVRKGSQLLDISSVFDTITVQSFPAIIDGYSLCTRLLVMDEAVCSVSIFMESPSLIRFPVLKPMACKPGVNGKVTVDCKISRLSLAEPGIYTFELRANDRPLSKYYMTAVNRRSRDATAEGGAAPNLYAFADVDVAKKIVSRLYQATFGMHERCKSAPQDAAEAFKIELDRFGAEYPDLLNLMQASPHYEAARRQFSEHCAAPGAADTAESLAAECGAAAQLLRAMLDEPQGRRTAREYIVQLTAK